MDIVKLIHLSEKGEATESERKDLADWIALSSENREDYEDLRFVLGYVERPDLPHVTQEEHDRSYERLMAGIDRLERREAKVRTIRRLGIGAVIVAIAAVIYIYMASASEVGFIRFTNEPLRNVVSVIEKKYDVTIGLEEGLWNCEFTGVIMTSASIDDVLMAIANTLRIEFTAESVGRYELRGDHCNQPAQRRR